MSDITIRLDGLLLATFLAVATLVYSLLAVGFWLAALQSTARGRHARRARGATGFALASVAGLIAATRYMDRANALTGPDWVDWLVVPALALFMVGCWWLYRLGRD